MPFADFADVRLHYRFDGPVGAPVLMLSNSLGTDLAMWEAQMPRLTRDHRVLRYDTRGHGQSSVPPGLTISASVAMAWPCSIDSPARPRDVLRVIAWRDDGDVARYPVPARIARLVLANTAARGRS
jgi:3-oxoadipate enol-lactonase